MTGSRTWPGFLDEHRQAYDLLEQGIEDHNLPAIGEAATLSAMLHQAILYNPLIEDAYRLARKIGAAGICRAHSGTLVGLLFDPLNYDEVHLLNFIRSRLPARAHLQTASLTGGGPRYVDSHQLFEQVTGK